MEKGGGGLRGIFFLFYRSILKAEAPMEWKLGHIERWSVTLKRRDVFVVSSRVPFSLLFFTRVDVARSRVVDFPFAPTGFGPESRQDRISLRPFRKSVRRRVRGDCISSHTTAPVKAIKFPSDRSICNRPRSGRRKRSLFRQRRT